MNILIIGKYYQEGFARHIAETLEDMGHSTIKYDIGPKGYTGNYIVLKRMSQIKDVLVSNLNSLKYFQTFENNKFKKTLSGQKVDLTIVTHDFLFPSQVKYLKELSKAPVVLWHPDHIANCGKFMFINAPYDVLFFKDPYMVQTFKIELQLNAFYLPECCNPKKHFPVTLSEKDKAYYGCDITTAGNMHPSREAFFRQLKGYDIKIWGAPAPNWLLMSDVKKMMMNKLVLNEEKSKAFQAAKIVLNNLFPAEIWGVNVRTFEIPACGGFQLVNWRPGLDQLLKDGDEIVSFKDKNDLIEKIDYYLKNDDERKRIIDNGYQKVNAQHTYKIRLQLLIDTVFSNSRGFIPPMVKQEVLP